MRGMQEGQTGEGEGVTRAEIGVAWPQAKGCGQPLEAEGTKVGPPREAAEGTSTVDILT